MDIAELTQHMHDFVRAKGWYDPGTPRPQTPRNIATSICIEAAEILEHFQWNGAVEDRAALAGELADVALYLLQLASVTGIDLQAAILDKLAINYARAWDAAETADDTKTADGAPTGEEPPSP
jgi:NTP pyrophosphatase (non-canonical NTP hydrolase)